MAKRCGDSIRQNDSMWQNDSKSTLIRSCKTICHSLHSIWQNKTRCDNTKTTTDWKRLWW
jgi:hypothetical protein